MVRRTKEEAEQTRRQILAAARRAFLARGVSSTTLEHIAQEAGVTRGAIYWHFANKEELFRAMREEVEVPLRDKTDFTLLQDVGIEPLDRMRNFMLELLDAVSEQTDLRQTFEILEFKCEYVGLIDDVEQHLCEVDAFQSKLLRVYEEAERKGQLRPGMPPRFAALNTMCFIMGLLRMWLLDGRHRLVRCDAAALIHAHVDERRAAPATAAHAAPEAAAPLAALSLNPA